MSGNINTREFSINDYDAAVELWQRVEGLEIAEGDDREGVAQFLARNPGLSRVATDGSETVGVALCSHDGRRGHIYHLAVDPTYQGRGLGSRLLDECLDGLRRTGVKRVLIMVADDNPRGREVWKRRGWVEITGAIAMGVDLQIAKTGASERYISRDRCRTRCELDRHRRRVRAGNKRTAHSRGAPSLSQGTCYRYERRSDQARTGPVGA